MINIKFIFAVLNLFLLIEIGICQPIKRSNSSQKNLAIAHILLDINEEDSALVFLNACLSEKFDDWEALFLRAGIYSNKKYFQKALTDYNALIALNPGHKEVVYSRGLARYQLSQFDLAIDDFQNALKLTDGETQTAFFKIEDGSNAASGITTISSMKSDIWNNIGLCYLALNQYEKAILSFDNGIKTNTKSIDLYINRALAFEKLGEIAPAIRDYEFVLSKKPNHPIATYNLMNIRKNHDSVNDQLEALSSFIEENPSFSQGYASRGLFYYNATNYESALSDFNVALKLNPENIDYLFNLALCHEKLKKTYEAAKLFLTVIELDPGHSGAYFNLGNLQFKQGLFDDAITYYTLAHHYNSKNASILYNRALAYFEKNLLKKACQDMIEVKKLDSSLANDFYRKHCAVDP